MSDHTSMRATKPFHVSAEWWLDSLTEWGAHILQAETASDAETCAYKIALACEMLEFQLRGLASEEGP